MPLSTLYRVVCGEQMRQKVYLIVCCKEHLALLPINKKRVLSRISKMRNDWADLMGVRG